MKYYWFLHLRRGKKNYRKWAFLIQVPLDTCFVLNEYLQVGWQLLYHLFIHNTAFHWCYVYLIGDVYTVEALLLQATGSLATVSPARNVFFILVVFSGIEKLGKFPVVHYPLNVSVGSSSAWSGICSRDTQPRLGVQMSLFQLKK